MVPELRKDYVETPLTNRLRRDHPQLDRILERHRDAVKENLPCYTDPVTGLTVMTASFLASRNYCCESGCRHCPYVER